VKELKNTTKNRDGNTGFWHSMLSDSGVISMRRFIVLIISILFILLCILFPLQLHSYIKHERNERVILALLKIFDKMVDNQFYIVLGGLGLVAVSQFGQAVIIRAKAKFAGADTPDTYVQQNVENQNVTGTAEVKMDNKEENKIVNDKDL